MIVPPRERNPDPIIPERPHLHDDTHFAAGRIAIFQYSTVIAFVFLIGGFWKLQVQHSEYYGERAEQNRIKSRPLLAPRGRLLDRDGRIIVDNRASYTLLLTRENYRPENLAAIAEGLNLDLADLRDELKRMARRPKYEAIRLKDEMSPADLAFVNAHRDSFPELDIIASQPRLYPKDGMLAHVVGYTGEINEEELELPEFGRYEPGDIIGKTGLERQYNSILMGEDGQQRVEVDVRGQVRQSIEEKPAVPGKDLQTTIDLDLQSVAELAMDGKNGAVVALDPRTGEILAMVSRPTFDPNQFVGRISRREWSAINSNPDRPLMNRATQAQLAPGSTFKPVVALAALETGTITEKFTVRCPGFVTLYGHTYHCMETHGSLSLHNGIVHSCDSYFFTVGDKLGIDKLARYAEMVGFGRTTGIDLPEEKAGVVPSPAQVLRTQRRKWYAGETPSVAIGQGDLRVTPLQLARAIGGLAMGGEWLTPHLVKGSQGAGRTEFAVDPAHIESVVDGMCGVVNEGGTGSRAAIPGIELCGKTGTAQLASLDKVKSVAAGRRQQLRDNAWFVGFAPRNSPEIVVVALFENGGRGQFASTIVRDVVKTYLDKKVRVETWLQRRSTVTAGLRDAVALGLPGAVH